MLSITASVPQRLATILADEVKAGERAVTAGIRAVTSGAQTELRGQVASAFGQRARGLSNAWRQRVFPRTGESLGAAGVVWTQAPTIIAAFDQGAIIRPKNGARYLAIPTGFNRPMGRRGGRARVSPADMVASKRAFLVPFRNGPGRGFLWCLKTQRDASRGRGSRAVFAAGRWEVGTGRGGGRRADGTRALTGRQVRERLLAQGFVPMFVLLRQVRLDRRLDVSAVARRWGARLGQTIADNWQAPRG